MDARFDKNETELRIFVLSITLEMFADGNGLARPCKLKLIHLLKGT